jgi:hypothetical protein
LRSFFEAHAVFALVCEALRRIPVKLDLAHALIVIHICKYKQGRPPKP